MKTMKILYSIILIFLSVIVFAQDKNLLAKIAFEDAETAYAAGKINETLNELKKVDSLLKTITPKSQYLRVQAWNLAANQNPSDLGGAIQNCKIYLELALPWFVSHEPFP